VIFDKSQLSEPHESVAITKKNRKTTEQIAARAATTQINAVATRSAGERLGVDEAAGVAIMVRLCLVGRPEYSSVHAAGAPSRTPRRGLIQTGFPSRVFRDAPV